MVYLLFFFSGAAGLVYELVWTRELSFVFGGTTYAITTTVAAFMAGLGLGSWIAGRCAMRVGRAARLYAILEIFIGLYALFVPNLLHGAEPLYRALYAQASAAPGLLTAARFFVSAIFLLLPTTAMGATLPVLARYVATGRDDRAGGLVGTLYGINTLGAVVGTLAAGFWLLPWLGLTLTTRAAAGVNVLIGITALVALRRQTPGLDASTSVSSSRASLPLPQRRIILLAFALSGFAAMVYQVAWTRALIVSLGSSTYSFTCILAAFILGLAMGSLAMSRRMRGGFDPLRAAGAIELGIGVAAVLVLPLYAIVPEIVYGIVSRASASFAGLMFLKFLLVVAATLVPTFLMGMLFPLVIDLTSHDEDASRATATAYAFNTIGTIVGSLLAGFVLIRGDVLGTRSSIVLAAMLNVAAGAVLMMMSRRKSESWFKPLSIAIAGVAIVLGLPILFGRWDAIALTSAPYLEENPEDLRQNWTIDYLREGVEMNVAVLTQKLNSEFISLRVNGKTDASTSPGDMATQLWLGHLPALLTPRARSACVIGLGSGVTVGALTRYPRIERIECVELSDEVIHAAGYFADYNHDALRADRRVKIVRADGRNHLLLTDSTYDLIVSEPSNPWISGVGNLFTREFFQLCDRRLSPDGRVCIWIHGYMMSEQDFRLIVRTLGDVFPFVSLWETAADDYALIASHAPPGMAASEFVEAFSHPEVREDLYRIGAGAPERGLGQFLACGQPLQAWAGRGEIHRDDNAILEFSAPRAMYRRADPTMVRGLIALGQSPFEDVVLLDPTNAAHRLLREKTAAVTAARSLRLSAAQTIVAGDATAALRTLLEGLRRDPGNSEMYGFAGDTAKVLVESSDEQGVSGEARAMAAQVSELRVPTRSPLRGQSLQEISQALRAKARAAAGRKHWPIAVDYLTEASQLDPRSGTVVVELAGALAEAGREEEALARLGESMSSRTVTRSMIQASSQLDRLRGDARLEALMKRFDANP